MDVRIVTGPFDPQAECTGFATGRDNTGALVSFVGLCRATNGGEAVVSLDIQQYDGFTRKEMMRLADEVAVQCDCPDLLVVHRVGHIRPGEAIVLVAALSVHRASAFSAVQALMDYLKTDAPLWKKESGPGGSRWIEPRAEDHARRSAAGRDVS